MMTKAKIYYRDIGDYLSRDEKLAIVKKNRSIANMQWQTLTPNEHGDWLNQRNDAFSSFIPLEPEKKFDVKAKSFFNTYAIGVATNRDAWVYSFSKEKLSENMQRMIDFYNEQREALVVAKNLSPDLEIEDFIDTNHAKISWTRALRRDASNNIQHTFRNEFRHCSYRPFQKLWLYYDKAFIESPGLWSQLFPTKEHKNLVICITGAGGSKDFAPLISNSIPNLHLVENGQYFPIYYYEENKIQQANLFDNSPFGGEGAYIRRDAVSNFILERAQKQYSKNVTKEDIFYYVYGFLHSPQYRETFASDLKKMLPRLPLVEDVRDFWAFCKAGRALAELHLNYERIGKYPSVLEMYHPLNISDTLKQANADEMEFLNYRVEKMRFPKKDQKDTIIYNSQITIENIPAEAYEYVVNGKSAIEWIMERYQITTHKESGIVNNPNDWAIETGNPRYILDLLLSVINVSVQTVEIVKGLPEVGFEE
jgi:predicted helicase